MTAHRAGTVWQHRTESGRLMTVRSQSFDGLCDDAVDLSIGVLMDNHIFGLRTVIISS